MKHHWPDFTVWLNPNNGLYITDWRKKNGHMASDYPKFSIRCETPDELTQQRKRIAANKENKT